MIPNTKISQTILEFGKSVILSLPTNASKEEFEATMRFIVSVWNSVVIDSWNNTTEAEQRLLFIGGVTAIASGDKVAELHHRLTAEDLLIHGVL